MGHKAMEETMRYVHVAKDHLREIPDAIQAAGRTELDPTKRVMRMLSARADDTLCANSVPTAAPGKEETEVIQVLP
jgi:hypothetical protein